MHDLLAIAAGVIVGFVLGMVGGGGSIVALPLLLYLVGVPSAHAAIGTSAVAVSLTALINLLMQAGSGRIKWPCALAFSASGMIGTAIGSHIALLVPGAHLIALFGGLMIAVGATMLLRKNAEGDPDVRLSLKTASRMLPWLVASGAAVGMVSGFFGIGGGFLIVPAMMFATGMPIQNAAATSLVSIVLFGATTAANYAHAGMVDWRVATTFIAGGVGGGVAGTAVSKLISRSKASLNQIFALLVIVTGCYVLLKNLS